MFHYLYHGLHLPIKLGQMTNLNVMFHVWCQFINWLKFETHPIPCTIPEWAITTRTL